MKTILIIFTLAMCGCDNTPKTANKNEMPIGSLSEINSVEFEGHQFIVAKINNNSISIIHHPGCKCGK